MSRNELIDLTMQLHHETQAAVLVSEDGERDNAVWLPLSQVEIEKTDKPGIIVVTMPTWLARERGLI